jgi:hypothetical protein
MFGAVHLGHQQVRLLDQKVHKDLKAQLAQQVLQAL